jgi:hypothetical protein
MATLQRLGGGAAVLTATLLIVGLVGLVVQQQVLGLRNWLVVLFQMNSGIGSLPPNPLHILNPLDGALLALVGLTFLGLWPVLSGQHRNWTAIAIALPFIGIPLLLTTGLQGRSAVMGAGVLISALMFVSRNRRRVLGSIGLLANVLLLASDFGTGALAGGLVAPAVAVGYLLLLGWYVLLALSLLGRQQTSAG